MVFIEKKRCNRQRLQMVCVLLIAIVTALVGGASAEPINDLLLLPALKSTRATGSILLDVTSTDQRLVVVGERGHILLSDNNGIDWRQVDVPVSVTLTAVYFSSVEKGWAVGHDGVVLHTQDGGESWVVQLDGRMVYEQLIEYYEKLVVYKKAALENTNETQKEKASIELENVLYALEYAKVAVENDALQPFLDVRFLDDRTGFIVGSYGLLFRTEDGGENWLPWSDRLDNPGGFHLNAIASGASGLFIAGEAGTLYRSLDGGINWNSLKSPYEGSYFGIVANENSDQVIVFGLRGNAFVSSDNGESWQRINTQVETPLFGGVLLSDGRVAIASNNILIADLEKLQCIVLKVKVGVYSAVNESANGQLILVGLAGVGRVEEINLKSEE